MRTSSTGGTGDAPAKQRGQGIAGQTQEDQRTQGQAGAVQHAMAVQLLGFHLAGGREVRAEPS